MTDRPAEVWDSGQAYEPYVGRWSRLIAARFLRSIPARPLAAWCDVGCGTGALAHAILNSENPSRVIGVDPSEGYLAAAHQQADNVRFEVRVGTAAAIPAEDGEFDRVVSALVLNFVPDPLNAIAEMRRVARGDGLIAGYVWDYADGMGIIRDSGTLPSSWIRQSPTLMKASASESAGPNRYGVSSRWRA